MLAWWVAGLLQAADGGAVLGAFSPDGGLVALVRAPNRLLLRSVVTGVETPLGPVDGAATDLRFVNDTTLLVTATHVSSVDVSRHTSTDLTPWAQTPVTMLWHRRSQALVATSKRAGALPDVFRLSLDGGTTLDTKNSGLVTSWWPDADGLIRASLSEGRAGSTLTVRDSVKGPWRVLIAASADETVRPITFSWDGVGLVLVTSVASDTSRVVEKHLGTGAERLLARNENSDVREWWLQPSRPALHAVAFDVDGGTTWQALESSTRADLELLASLRPPASPVNRDGSDTQWLVRQGGVLGHFDRVTKRITLFDAVPPKPIPMPFQFSARDGVPLSGWLVKGAADAGLVIVTHDSVPERRLTPERLPEMVDLVERGIWVLFLNARGVVGFGKQRWAAGATLMQHLDVIDAAAWAQSQGLTQRAVVWGSGLGATVALAAAQADARLIRGAAVRDVPRSARALLPARFVGGVAGEPWRVSATGPAVFDARDGERLLAFLRRPDTIKP